MTQENKKALGTFTLSKEHKNFEKDGEKVEWDDLTLDVNGYPIKILIKKEHKELFELALAGRIK